MVVPFSTEASVVAMYGLQFSTDRVDAAYRHLLEWFDSLECHPDRAGVSGDGFKDGVGSFDEFDRQLQRRGFSEVRGLNLYCLVPDGEIPGSDWCVSVDIDHGRSLCVVGARSSIAPIPGGAMASIARTLIRDFDPVYGIGFRREMEFGPTFYAMGGNVGWNLWGEERQKAERIQRWWTDGIEQRIYLKGVLRDVYPWNLLTHLQLGRQVEGVPLKQWIADDHSRGTLSSFEGSTWLWEVSNGMRPRVRVAMASEGALFDAGPRD